MPSNSNTMLPFFYNQSENIENQSNLVLDEDNSKHIVQVLRMKEGDLLNITNGLGQIARCSLSLAHKKNAVVKVESVENFEKEQSQIWLAISFTKNRSRTEWLLEKATELGVDGIIPLSCKRSERLNWNQERQIKILISAMLQSQQAFLPVLTDICPIEKVENLATLGDISDYNIGIAHCISGKKESLLKFYNKDKHSLIFIGPEGDFTDEEVALILAKGAKGIDLGKTRLRTETAGLHSVSLLKALRDEAY